MRAGVSPRYCQDNFNAAGRGSAEWPLRAASARYMGQSPAEPAESGSRSESSPRRKASLNWAMILTDSEREQVPSAPQVTYPPGGRGTRHFLELREIHSD